MTAVNVPVSVEFIEVRRIPLGTQVNVREYLRGSVHLTQHGEHLLVDERFVLAQVHIQCLFQPTSDKLGGHFVQIHTHHDFFQSTAYYAFRFFTFTGSKNIIFLMRNTYVITNSALNRLFLVQNNDNHNRNFKLIYFSS